MSNNLFERAVRLKLRFDTNKGAISVEDLWDLPLQSKSGFDLDNVAKRANADLKAMAEESFVATSTNPAKAQAELRFELVKHVISVRLAENDAASKRAQQADEKQKLMGLLAKKQDAALEGLTVEELQARISQLSAS